MNFLAKSNSGLDEESTRTTMSSLGSFRLPSLYLKLGAGCSSGILVLSGRFLNAARFLPDFLGRTRWSRFDILGIQVGTPV